MNTDKPRFGKDKPHFKWAVTILLIVFISILMVVVLTNLPGFFRLLKTVMRILSPLLTGAALAFLLNPLVRSADDRLRPVLEKRCKRLDAKKLSRALSIIFALLVAATLVYAVFSMLLPQLHESVLGIVGNAELYYKNVEKAVSSLLEDNPELRDYADHALREGYALLNNWVSTSLLSDMQKLFTTLTTSVLAVFRGAANFIIGLVASVYILWSKETFQAQAKKVVAAFCPPDRANHLYYLGRETNKIFNGFVIGKLIDAMIIGILCYIGMLILKLPYPELIATVIGVMNVVPFFGPFIGAVPCALLILLNNPLQAFYFIIFIIVLQQIDGNVIAPKILGNTVGISGFWVLISITVATGIFGFAGMLLGVPVFAVLYLLLSDAVELALHKKGLTTRTQEYQTVCEVEDIPKQETAEQAQTT